MTDSFEFDVQGLSELDARLEKLDNETAGKALFSALMSASTPMLKTAKEKAATAKEPHSMKYGNKTVEVQPGLLKDSIRRKRVPAREMTGELKNGAAVGIYIGKGIKQKLYPRYWHFVERGTKNVAATPFLRPAFDQNIEKSVERFKKQLTKKIDKLTETS